MPPPTWASIQHDVCSKTLKSVTMLESARDGRVRGDLPDAVESGVAFNVLGELERVARLAGKGHDEVVAQHLLLVHVRLHLDDRARRIRVRCDDRVALARDTERALHLGLRVQCGSRGLKVEALERRAGVGALRCGGAMMRLRLVDVRRCDATRGARSRWIEEWE
ncbi:hypothetical protein L1887_59848 [Cichorium endivia]|nr:hypothetical protein L1887_59848 [Cichorium endivia]